MIKKIKRFFSLVIFGFPFLLVFFSVNICLRLPPDIQEYFSLNFSKSLPDCILMGKECRFDEIGKYIEDSSVLKIVHPLSGVLPESRKVLRSSVKNTTYMKNTRLIGPRDGSETPLFEYNPTIVPITHDWDEKLKSYVTGSYHPNITTEDSERVQFIYVARVSNLHACVKGRKKMYNPTKEQSYLSITLLDIDLNPIDNASIVVSPMHAMMPSCYQKSGLSYFQDYQVIAARSTKSNSKKDQLFLFASDKASYMFPMDLRRVPIISHENSNWKTKMISLSVEINNPPFSYGSGLQVRFWKNEDLIPKGAKPYCQEFLKYNKIGLRKNYHFFEHGNLTFMEHRPHWIRTTQEISFIAEKFHTYEDWPESKRFPTKTKVMNRFRKGAGEPNPTFLHSNTTRWRKSREGRGTSCCINIETKTSKTYKVGISHETTENRGYVSRFYAFDRKSPHFQIRAISGAFCLMNFDKKHDRFGSLQVLNSTFNLADNSTTYKCPEVTFLSGISTYKKDNKLAIISYGINDCISRSIVVPKTVIITLLALD